MSLPWAEVWSLGVSGGNSVDKTLRSKGQLSIRALIPLGVDLRGSQDPLLREAGSEAWTRQEQASFLPFVSQNSTI